MCSESPALSRHSGCHEDKVTVTAGDCGLTCSNKNNIQNLQLFVSQTWPAPTLSPLHNHLDRNEIILHAKPSLPDEFLL